jgi:hypothetical protein
VNVTQYVVGISFPDLQALLSFPAEFRSGPIDLSNRFLFPKIPMPFCIIKRLSHHKGDESFGVNLTEGVNQHLKSFDLDFSVSDHSISSLINETGSVTLTSVASVAFFTN